MKYPLGDDIILLMVPGPTTFSGGVPVGREISAGADIKDVVTLNLLLEMEPLLAGKCAVWCAA